MLIGGGVAKASLWWPLLMGRIVSAPGPQARGPIAKLARVKGEQSKARQVAIGQ